MIKRTEAKDIDKIMSIWLETNISAHSFIKKEDWENVFDDVKELLPASEIFAYYDEDAIKGFAGITDKSYIAGLFVDKKYQSQGIGRQLLNHCKNIYSHLELDVFSENAGAVRFYQKNGFVLVKTKMNAEFSCEEYHMVWPK